MDSNIPEVSLDNFEEFEKIARDEICKNKIEQTTQILFKPTDVLFRGQANSEWKLESTLARETQIYKFNEEDYHHYIKSIKPIIEQQTRKIWDLPEYFNPPVLLEKHRDMLSHPIGYEYMVYLRHFGFPSPLLDWTDSFYIAAFFAFSNPENKKVSIYIYKQSNDSSMVSEKTKTVLHLGNYINTHPRHWLQQAQYTICKSCTRDEDSEELRFKYFYDSFENYEWNNDLLGDGNIRNQCIKYTIPSNERDKVIKLIKNRYINENFLMNNSDESIKAEEELISKLKCDFLKKLQEGDS